MNLELAFIVSDVCHKGNFESFAYTLGLMVDKKEKQVPFADSSNWKNGFADVMFSSKGTLICVPFGEYNVAAASKSSTVTLVSVNEKTQFVNIECAENGSMKRIFTVKQGAVHRNVRKPLNWESTAGNYEKLLSDCVKASTGKKLVEYKNQLATRYSIR
jgi:hypothetical protein